MEKICVIWRKCLAHIRGTHHVPEMGAQSSCSLVVLHYTVIVEDFSTAFTVTENKQFLQSFRLMAAFISTLFGQCESIHNDLKKIIHDNNITLSISFTVKQAEDQR